MTGIAQTCGPRGLFLPILLSLVVALPGLEAKSAALLLPLGLIAAWALWKGWPGLSPDTPAAWTAWALAGIHALSALRGGITPEEAARTAAALALAAVLTWASRMEGGEARRLLLWLTLLGALVGGVVSVQCRGPEPGAATFGHKGLAAAFLSIALPSALALVLAPDLKGLRRIAALAAACAIALALLLGQTRAAWLAAAAGATLAVTLTGWTRRRMILAACALTALAVLGGPALRDRALTIVRNRDPRLLLWQVSWEAWKENPLLGAGPGRFGETAAPVAARRLEETQIDSWSPFAHNDLLQTGVETGWAGVAALLLLGAALVRALRCGDPLLRAAAGGGLLAGGVNALLSFPLYEPACSLALALLAGIAAAGGSRREGGTPARPRLALLLLLALLLTLSLPPGRGLRFHPRDGRVWTGRGQEALAEGRTALALARFARAQALAPWHADARLGLARAHAQGGDYASAYRILDDCALRIFPSDFVGFFYHEHARLLLQEGNLFHAAGYLRQALVQQGLSGRHDLFDRKEAQARLDDLERRLGR